MGAIRVGRLTEAALVEVKARDYVSWPASSGTARGRVKSVHKGKVPAVPVKVVGSDIEPAARVEEYVQEDGGWVPTGRYQGIPSGSLAKIDDLAPPEVKSTEAVASGSFDQIRRQVQAAIEDRLEADATSAGSRLADSVYVYVCDIGPDWAVYNSGYGDDQFKVSYSIDDAGAVTLGTPVEVTAVTTYQPVSQPDTLGSAATESRQEQDRVTGHLLEAKGVDDATGSRIFGVRIIAAGDSLNGRRYPLPVLESAATLYEGAKAFDHHRSEAELRSSTIAGLIGSYRNVEAKADGLYGDLYLLPSATHTAEALDASLAAQADGLKPLVGISHDVMASYKPVVDGGRRLQEATQIVSVNSADVVADPAAGGRATRMVAGGIATTDSKEKKVDLEELLAMLTSATPEQLQSAGLAKVAAPAAAPAAAAAEPTTEAVIQRDGLMGRTLIAAAVAGAKLPAPVAAQLTEAVTALLPDQCTESQVTAQVASAVGLLGTFEKANLLPSVPSVEVTKEAHDKKVERLDKTFGGDFVGGYRSFKEAYFDITGERPSFAGDSDVNRRILVESIAGQGSIDFSQRGAESVTTSTWSTVLGDAITRRMVSEYQQPNLSTWRQVVSSIVPVNDFRTQRIERLGGYGILPVVNQGAPYQPLTTPGNEEATYALSKKGGTEDLTLETIANDDMRTVARIPVKLGLAAAQTLYRFVWDTLAANMTCSFDATALFAAGHNNIDAGNVLSQTNLSTGRKKMRRQTAYGDATDVLSIVPKFLVVPSDLEELAYQLSTSAVAIPATPAGPSNTPNIHQGLTPIIVDYFTAAATWFLIGDPSTVPTFEIGFYQGRQDPDLLVQSDPTVGSVFTSDKITYKIRHIYSGTVLDFRGFYRGN